MTTTKTATLSFRVEPVLKKSSRTASEREHRSITNMVDIDSRLLPTQPHHDPGAGRTVREAVATQKPNLKHA
jgi:hypothetical protein